MLIFHPSCKACNFGSTGGLAASLRSGITSTVSGPPKGTKVSTQSIFAVRSDAGPVRVLRSAHVSGKSFPTAYCIPVHCTRTVVPPGSRGGARQGGDAKAPTARSDAVHGTHPSGKWRNPWTEPVLALVETQERCEPYERCERSPVDRWRKEEFADSEDCCRSDDDECSRRSSRVGEGVSPVISWLLIPGPRGKEVTENAVSPLLQGGAVTEFFYFKTDSSP